MVRGWSGEESDSSRGGTGVVRASMNLSGSERLSSRANQTSDLSCGSEKLDSWSICEKKLWKKKKKLNPEALSLYVSPFQFGSIYYNSLQYNVVH